ncbi:MAG: GNAT family N-acetyltransferase, partial [Thermodesulfobacteriota bacterium]
LSARFMTKIIEGSVKNGEYFLTATYNGKYAGKLVYQLFVFDSDTAIITDLEVLKVLRRKGIATKLVETAVDRIFVRKYIKRVWIQDGSCDGSTGRLVRKLGFMKAEKEGIPSYELRRKI